MPIYRLTMAVLATLAALLVTGPTTLGGGIDKADEEFRGDIGDDGISASGTWKFFPAKGIWTNAPIGLTQDPMGYDYEIVCLVDRSYLDPVCLAGKRECNTAKDGQLVQWYSGPKNTLRETWDPLGEESCVYAVEPVDVMEEIAGLVLREFQSRPVDPGVLGVQPSPHTLIGMQTNFFIDSPEQVFDLRLLGQEVRITAVPTEYTWNYGDGHTYGPVPDPGVKLATGRWGEQTATSHMYETTGDYPVSVTVHFSGEYSVNDGQAIPIQGRGEFTTAEQLISVWKTDRRSVADTCLDNPTAWAC